jgi:molybdopterin-guanine dinucleotide biosynthesis protein A
MKAMPITPKNPSHVSSPFQRITGVILAGGKSTRYGKNKAFVEISGTPLVERVIGVMGSVFERLILITNTPHEYRHLKLPMVEDLIKGLGPLGGIYTGLSAISEEAGFFVACDMPFLNADLLRYMVGLQAGFDAVVPRVDWMIEPLHALYTRRSLTALKEQIDAHDYQIVRFFERIRVRYLDEHELRALDPAFRSFLNVNRPEDLLEIRDEET